MANMSYCRFENTSNDLTDCQCAIEDALNDEVSFVEFIEDMSEYERRAVRRMYRQCKDFIEAYEELVGDEEK